MKPEINKSDHDVHPLPDYTFTKKSIDSLIYPVLSNIWLFLDRMVEYHALFDKLEGLTDLEAAVLLCIVAREHCIVDTERDAIEDLENELKLVCNGSSYFI